MGVGQVTSDLSWASRQADQSGIRGNMRRRGGRNHCQRLLMAASPGQFAYFPMDLGIGSSAKLGEAGRGGWPVPVE